MANFFDTVIGRWPAGREDYHWHILPDPEWVRTALFEPYRELTHRDGLAPVAPQWTHVTVLHSGPVDAFRAEEVEQVVDLVRAGCTAIAPFELTLDRPAPGRVALECAGRPGAPARQLWQLTGEATRAVTRDRFPLIPELYYPHASLAYGVATFDHRPLKVSLSDHDHGPVSFLVSKVSLVAQSHDGRFITWRHVRDVSLTG
ncbi:2'-5' RNA ligase family protein [Dactylosporangium sp. NPDC051485]|uniref:2'-5' RNA ligase family protein n=1 Tax=Dactylosporangium sp. NPDC051485 TaxID=3154846 RepID=UPI0034399404